MNSLKVLPGKLNGIIHAPTSKSQTHRAILCAAMADGQSIIDKVVLSHDILATIGAAEALGAEIDILNYNKSEALIKLVVKGKGRLERKRKTIDCIESGSTLRFSLPMALTTGQAFEFTGRGKLPNRPMGAYYKIFREKGIIYETDNGRLPLLVKGRLSNGMYKLEGNVSSQYISGLLLALPLLEGPSEIVLESPLESEKYVDITLNVQKSFGVKIERQAYERFFIEKQNYKPANMVMEGDYSQAAFWIVGGLLGQGIEIGGLRKDSDQGDKIVIELLKKMGARINESGNNLKVEKSSMKSTVIDASPCPDIVPVMAVAAALAEGTTRIIKAGRLRFKESDRLRATALELNKLGARVMETEDGLIIEGLASLAGGVRVWSHNDHRIAMAMAVASTVCEKPVIIEGMEAIKKSYPDFTKDFKKLGGKIHELNMG